MPERKVSAAGAEGLRAELTAAGLIGPGERRIGWSAAVALAGLAACVAWLVLGPPNGWQLVNALTCGFFMVQVGFVAHDAGHGTVLRSARMNRLLSWLCWALFTGLSDAWWRDKHQRHHRHVNDPMLDPDFYPVLSYSSSEALAARGLKRAIARHQALFLLPLLACSRLYFQLLSLSFACAHPAARVRDLPLMALHHAVFLGLPLALLELPLAATFLVVSYAVTGLYMGLVFMPNHWGMPLVSASTSGVPALHARIDPRTLEPSLGAYLLRVFMLSAFVPDLRSRSLRADVQGPS